MSKIVWIGTNQLPRTNLWPEKMKPKSAYASSWKI